jgi:hypothetical protein
MKHNRRFSDVELIPNGPLLLTLPELAAHLRIDDEPHAFFLEFDRGTEGNRQYATKLSAYYRYRDSGLAARDYNGFPTVLFVTTDPRAEHRIAEAARRVAFIRGGSPLHVLTTSTARIQSHEGGVLGPIWLSHPTEQSSQLLYWPEGRPLRGSFVRHLLPLELSSGMSPSRKENSR